MRRIGVVTVSRSDYGIYVPVLRAIEEHPALELQLFVAGMHLAPAFGHTVRVIEADGWPITDRIDIQLAGDTPEDIAAAIGRGTIGFARSFAQHRPDILVVLGDRFDMYAAALAALPSKIPVAHIHGGEVTTGAMDDALRHSMTKLSHLHFVSTDVSAARVAQLGEAPWRMTVSGAPALDAIRTIPLWSRDELVERLHVPLPQAPVIVTFHPVTLEYEQTAWQVDELLAALESCDRPIVCTLPNADTYGRQIIERITRFVAGHAHAHLVPNLGSQGYFSLMSCAAAMVGNSSSGLIEAPSFGLPVVNIGTRQGGRERAANVIDVAYTRSAITEGLQRALDPDFRAALCDLENPYGDGHASPRIVQRIAEVPLDQTLLMKVFHDAPGAVPVEVIA